MSIYSLDNRTIGRTTTPENCLLDTCTGFLRLSELLVPTLRHTTLSPGVLWLPSCIPRTPKCLKPSFEVSPENFHPFSITVTLKLISQSQDSSSCRFDSKRRGDRGRGGTECVLFRLDLGLPRNVSQFRDERKKSHQSEKTPSAVQNRLLL